VRPPPEHHTLLAVTWNVAGRDPPPRDVLLRVLAATGGGGGGGVCAADVIAVGLQELVAMSGAQALVGVAAGAAGASTPGRARWERALAAALGGAYVPLASRQLAGLLLAVYVRAPLLQHARERDGGASAEVCVGLGGVLVRCGHASRRTRALTALRRATRAPWLCG
jgi:hypothetical protein